MNKKIAQFLFNNNILEKAEQIKESLINENIPPHLREKVSFLIALCFMPSKEIHRPTIKDVIYRLENWTKPNSDVYEILLQLIKKLKKTLNIND